MVSLFFFFSFFFSSNVSPSERLSFSLSFLRSSFSFSLTFSRSRLTLLLSLSMLESLSLSLSFLFFSFRSEEDFSDKRSRIFSSRLFNLYSTEEQITLSYRFWGVRFLRSSCFFFETIFVSWSFLFIFFSSLFLHGFSLAFIRFGRLRFRSQSRRTLWRCFSSWIAAPCY